MARAPRIFGHISGQPVDSWYSSREELSEAWVHRPLQAGIWGTAAEGASSIVLNGGYRDDEDHGDWILYTGHGGRDARGAQIAHQSMEDSGNAALARSATEGLPVRVIRGFKGDRRHSPAVGYRYDGLYRVVSYWSEPGVDGFLIWRFRLEKIDNGDGFAVEISGQSAPQGTPEPRRRPEWTQRIVRSTEVSDWVKRQYDFACQVCGLKLDISCGEYAEGAHILPLGGRHRGPDVPENVLCLCPNHHVQLDNGGILIDDGLTVRDRHGKEVGKLRTVRGHKISVEYLRQHRMNWAAVVQAPMDLAREADGRFVCNREESG